MKKMSVTILLVICFVFFVGGVADSIHFSRIGRANDMAYSFLLSIIFGYLSYFLHYKVKEME